MGPLPGRSGGSRGGVGVTGVLRPIRLGGETLGGIPLGVTPLGAPALGGATALGSTASTMLRGGGRTLLRPPRPRDFSDLPPSSATRRSIVSARPTGSPQRGGPPALGHPEPHARALGGGRRLPHRPAHRAGEGWRARAPGQPGAALGRAAAERHPPDGRGRSIAPSSPS